MPESFMELSVREFLDRVAADKSTPGSGAVAALTAALAAGLVAMVARGSVGSWAEGAGAAAQARRLEAGLRRLVQENAAAWGEALVALREPDEQLEEKLALAADVPLRIAEFAADVAVLAALTAERCDGSRRSDAAAAAVLAEAATRVAEKLVAVNLTIPEDDERRTQARLSAERAVAASRRALDSGP